MSQRGAALVTGASSGIGLALARDLAGRGYGVVAAARRADRLADLVAEIQRAGGRAIAVVCDVTKDGDVARAVAEGVRAFGSLEIVVANAGFGVVGPIGKLTVADFQRQFDTNVFGAVRTVKESLPELEKSRGRLALVGSVNGYLALSGNSPYAMSKFAVRALAESLALELAPKGLSVTHVAPGFIESEIRLVDNTGRFRDTWRDPVPRWIQGSAPGAARSIARALRWRCREVVITGHGKLVVFLHRHFPCLTYWLLRWLRVTARPEPK